MTSDIDTALGLMEWDLRRKRRLYKRRWQKTKRATDSAYRNRENEDARRKWARLRASAILSNMPFEDVRARWG